MYGFGIRILFVEVWRPTRHVHDDFLMLLIQTHRISEIIYKIHIHLYSRINYKILQELYRFHHFFGERFVFYPQFHYNKNQQQTTHVLCWHRSPRKTRCPNRSKLSTLFGLRSLRTTMPAFSTVDPWIIRLLRGVVIPLMFPKVPQSSLWVLVP